MEETTGVTGAANPAETPAPVAPEVTPVTPNVPEAPKPAEATQAAIEAASVPAEAPTEPAPQVEAAAAEQPSEEQVVQAAVEITDAMISVAVDLIRKTGRSSAAHFQKKMGLALETVNALLNKLTEKNVLGPENGTRPREILIQTDPKPAPQKPQAPKITVSSRPPQSKRPIITDYDRMQGWKKHLSEIGHYTDPEFIDAMADYAQKNPGFNARSKWGSCLIVMVNRLANKTKNSLRTFNQADAEYLQKELLRFFQEDPFGDSPAVWDKTYTTNAEQRSVINKFFFGQDASNRDLFRELKGKQALVMTAVRDAAWPNQMEEKNGTGGTFAQRFHYLAMAIIRFATSNFEKALFENSFHNSPTDEFLERVGGGRRPQAPVAPSWIEDGKCKECGFDVVKDSQGNDICSNPICMNHYARVASDAPKSFRTGGRPRPQAPVSFDPNQAPLPPEGGERRRNWKDKKDRRHGDHDDAERAFQKGGKKHGKRFRMNEGDDFEPTPSNSESEAVTVAHIGGEFPGNNAFASLTLPTTEAPAVEAQLPEPPPEQPVV